MNHWNSRAFRTHAQCQKKRRTVWLSVGPRRSLPLSRNSFAASAYRQKEPALSIGADATFEVTDHPVRRITPVPTAETLGQVRVHFALPPIFPWSTRTHHHSPARVSPIEECGCQKRHDVETSPRASVRYPIPASHSAQTLHCFRVR